MKKPWPSEAVIIVAARAGDEKPDQMDGPFVANCRDCYGDLIADIHTVHKAEHLPTRHGRPIEFLCVHCCLAYERPTELHDDRGRKLN